ncbi:MAG: adenosylcobinamide-phosphate synthase CbiB [Clostridia bacterium]|nr:adenosylcobinamide-phosphate synthase CbiB [Clostridia bacterium]
MNLSILFFDILIAYILDLLLGDPYWLPHPVSFIGSMIQKTEKVLRKFIQGSKSENKARQEFIAGILLMVIVVFASFGLVYLILYLARLLHPIAFHALNIYFIYSAIASKCLAVEAKKVLYALKKDGLAEARKKLAMLVGRQTENLSEEEVVRGTVETVAENTVDGIISPLFFVFIGSIFGIGAPFAYAFKAISTLDSMVGYMNERYLYFGRASAKTDDAANYLPARLSGIIIPLAAKLSGKSFLQSFRTMRRDRRNHKSPNCAYPEAAVAGALGVRLGGANVYFGQVVEKPTIGDPLKNLEPKDIEDTIKIMYVASFLAAAFGSMFFLAAARVLFYVRG